MKLIHIAINSIYQAVRMKFAVLFIFIMVAVVVFVPFMLKSDGTQKGMLQITLAYSMSVTNIILSLMVVFLSTTLFCADIRDKVIFTLDTKPVHRWQIILGKWAGIMLLNAVLLAAAGGAVYGLVRYMARPIPGREGENLILRSEVLTARRLVGPAEEASAPGRDFIVPFNTEHSWVFRRIRPHRGEEYVTVRFKHHSAAREAEAEPGIAGLWTVGDIEQTYYQNLLSMPGGEMNEFRVPVDYINEEGELHLRWRNLSANRAAAAFPRGDVNVLYRAGSFGANFVRSLLMVFIKLSFLSAVGLAASTFLTFPVATLLTLFVFMLCLSLPSISAVFSPPARAPGMAERGEAEPNPVAEQVRRAAVSSLKIFPNLRAYDPVPSLVDGLMLSGRKLSAALVFTFLIRNGLICVLGCYIFGRRELANMGYD